MARDTRQLAAIPDPDEVAVAVWKGAKRFARKHPVPVGTYLVGLLCALFVTGVAVTNEQATAYERIMSHQVAAASQDKADVANALHNYSRRYSAARGWFGGCSDARCVDAKRNYDLANADMKVLEGKELAALKLAKREVGLTSDYAVQETRDMFWRTFQGGKSFAKRQSMWDLLTIGFSRRRDEEMMSAVLRWLMNVMFNFTLGLTGACVGFVAYLPSLIATYTPNPATACFYFFLAAAAGIATSLTFILLMVGTAAGGCYGVAKVAHAQQLEAQQRRQGIHRE